MRASLRRLLIATVAGSLLVAGVLVASNSYSLNVPYNAVAWTGNVYLPPTVHYTAYKTTEKVLPESTISVPDYHLALNHQRVSRAGRPGLHRDVYLLKMTNSHVDAVRKVASKDVKPVPRVVAVGRYVAPPPVLPEPTPTSVGVPDTSGSSGVPSVAPPPATAPPVLLAGDPRSIARSLVGDSTQFSCLDLLWTHESGWSVTAENASSGAYGIPQSLPGSKMASAGADWQYNAATQIRWGLSYISGVYGTPCGAWAHELAVNWY